MGGVTAQQHTAQAGFVLSKFHNEKSPGPKSGAFLPLSFASSF
jgi:hypothetical protein